MSKYLAVLGRQPKISLAELESLFDGVKPIGPELAEFHSSETPNIDRLGGTLKIAEPIFGPIIKYLITQNFTGKITLGVSDFSHATSARKAQGEALKLKRILVRTGQSVRIIPNKTAVLSSATSFHNHLYKNQKIELIKNGNNWYRVIAVQNIDNYTRRDQARPARDARVGMLPPKLAQILINLCGPLPEKTRILDPFCGTGVVLQESALMGYVPYGTDLSPRMVEYSQKNLDWLKEQKWAMQTVVKITKKDVQNANQNHSSPLETVVKNTETEVGDAKTYQWSAPIDAVACEGYLGPPMSQIPPEIKLKQAKQECGSIILKFLQNLAPQIKSGTPVVMAIPAWLRSNPVPNHQVGLPDAVKTSKITTNGSQNRYERLKLLDEIQNMGYNVKSFKNLAQTDLLYYREGQVVAREIIVLRKK